MAFELRGSKGSKNFDVLEEGNHDAILGAFIDLGEKEGPFGTQDQVVAIWVTGEVDQESGEPLLGLQFLSKSNHPDSNVGKLVKAVTGKVIDENFDFDALMALLGKRATLATTQVERDGKTKSKIVLVTKAFKTNSVEVPEDWTPPEGLAKKAVKGGVYTKESLSGL